MSRTIHVTQQPVVLDGYQAVMKPSKFGRHNLAAVMEKDLIDRLEEERAELLKWQESKLKNPKRSILKPEPWEETGDKYVLKFSWKPVVWHVGQDRWHPACCPEQWCWY